MSTDPIPQPAVLIDQRGARCPLPVVALAQAITSHGAGTVVGLRADDPAAHLDVPAWCRMKEAEFLGELPDPDGGSGAIYVVRLPGAPASAGGSSSAAGSSSLT